ncbi:MAG: AraC family transcriptional regulator [bacterium]|nr:AraC family transcriptional regulator [bacterium]
MASVMDARRAALEAEYGRRINLAMDYVRANLDGDLSVVAIARAALFSPYHFHRLFTAMTGETLFDHVRRVRLEKAAASLMYDEGRSVTDIALDCGFGSSATFARAFRAHFGMSASEWRRRKASKESKERKTKRKPGKAPRGPLGYSGGRQRSTPHQRRCGMKVEVRELPPYRVAYVRSRRGYDQEAIHEAYETLFRWAGPRGLCCPQAKVIGASYDNPEITPAARCRYDACITIGADVNAEGPVSVKEFPGGRYAVYRWRGRPQDIGPVFGSLMGEWFPSSGYQPGDSPCLEFYHGDPDADPKGEATVDICMPVKPL